MPLTDIATKKARPEARAYKFSAAGGLYLYVTPAGGKSWRWKYQIDGKENQMTFGRYPDVSLAEAPNQLALL